MPRKKSLPSSRAEELISILQSRFQKNIQRHKEIGWERVLERLKKSPDKLWSLNAMEESGGEPDLIGYDSAEDRFFFADCSVETPQDRRSLCYDEEALISRKANKPAGSALQTAHEMGVQLLTERQYFQLQEKGEFDLKTSSWLLTPADIRKKGGALFGDRRFGRVFIYHNGAESYYGVRGFRCGLFL